jgi:hypothetical protein
MSRGEALNKSYPAVPEAVPLARRALAAVAAEAGAAGDRLYDIRLAVSEALTNAVVHAYRGGKVGRLHVTAAVASDELWVLIADDGRGLHARNDSQGLGIGLSLCLDFRELVSRDHHESPWMRADLLVLAHGQLDELVAAETGALTTEADWGVLVPWPLPALYALVHLADRRLVGRGAPLLVALHSRMFSRGANPRHTAGVAHFSDICG